VVVVGAVVVVVASGAVVTAGAELVVTGDGSVVAVVGGSAGSWPLQAVTTKRTARNARRIGPGYV
jgi:hypothetical protein